MKKGDAFPYIFGHWGKGERIEIEPPNPSGLCMCGCGQRTPLATQNLSPREGRPGLKKGHPICFCRGHHPDNSKYEYVEGVDYRLEDRGYLTPCWIWIRRDGRTDFRYGEFGAVYRRLRGEVPKGLDLDHLCRVTQCVNPDHLEPVTRKVNIRRSASTKLDERDVEAILRLRQRGVKRQVVAQLFGVSTETVALITSKKRKHPLQE